MTGLREEDEVAETAEHRYCVIGAGRAGLSAAKNLKQLGLPFVGFEAHTGVGGLWDCFVAPAPRNDKYFAVIARAEGPSRSRGKIVSIPTTGFRLSPE